VPRQGGTYNPPHRVPIQSPTSGPRYRFGEFVLDLDRGFLCRNGVEVPLRPKAFDVLRHLVQHQGKVVSKNALVDAVWPNAAVTDNSLSQCLFEIRRALDDESQRTIRTVARRGYVFQAAVSTDRDDVIGPSADTAGPVLPANDHSTASDARRIGRTVASVGLAMVTVGALVFVRTDARPTAADEQPVQLTDFNDSALSPSLSHDGRVLAFLRNGAFGRAAGGRDLYVKVLPSGSPVQLTRDRVTKDHPVFSPDDARIVYTTFQPPLRWDSWQVPMLGGTPEPFLPNASGVMWLDPRRVIYSTVMSGTHMGIARSTESRSEYEEIYFPGRADGMVHRTTPSPDHKWLLLVEMTGGTWLPCRLLPADGSSGGRQVSPPGGQCTSAAWSPDGRWMYFSSNVGGEFHLWRQRFPDGPPEQITFGPTEQEGTAITSDGRYVVTSMGLQQASIWLHDEAGDRKLTDERYTTQPVVVGSPNRMFYLVRTQFSRGQESGELWSVDLASGHRERMMPGVAMANYSLSHDVSKVVFTSAGTDRDAGVWIGDLQHRTPPRLLARGIDLRAFFGAPGEVIFTAEDNHLYRMREDGSGVERAAPELVAYLSTVSPDGRWAVAIVPNAAEGATTQLKFLSLHGERSFEVCNEACGTGPRSFLGAPPFTWSADGTSLLVNLIAFEHQTRRSVVLPYRSDAPATALWPRGLRTETDVLATPGAQPINAALTYPAHNASTYLTWTASMQSNLYRVRLPR
jgi:eukaryotic-like serine/threonine-protein kinase